MTVTKFDYMAPKTVREAVEALHQRGEDAVAMAGGTDLLVKIRRNLVNPKLVVGLKKIPGMNLIHFSEREGLTIGATALLSTVGEHKKILKYFPTIAMAARSTANTQVRNMGTIVGNICNAAPSADNAPILLAMGATLNIEGPRGNRKVELEHFFLGPGLTVLSPGELVTSVFVPKPPDNCGTAYFHLSQRGKMDCAAVGVGTMLTVRDGTFDDVRLFIGACAPTPIRAIKAEQILKGNKISDELINEASLQASKEIAPISDVRASAKYREIIVRVMSTRAIIEAKRMAISMD